MNRTRRVKNQKEMDKKIDEYITRGYKVKMRGSHSARMKKKDWGSGGNHLIIALFTIWWTLGLGNALYGIYKRATAEEIVIKVDSERTEQGHESQK